MRRPRLSISALMAVIGFLAFGLAALRYPTEFWASASFTLAVALVSIATVGGRLARGPRRPFWAGFAIVGWVALALGFGPWFPDTGVRPPPLLTTKLLAHLYPVLNDRPGLTHEPTDFDAAYSFAMRSNHQGGVVEVRQRETRAGGGVSTRAVDTYHYSQIGQALAAVVFAWFGGLAGLAFAGAAEERPTPIDPMHGHGRRP